MPGEAGAESESWEGGITERHEYNASGKGYILYLDCDDSFTDLFICQNLSSGTFQMHEIYYVSIILQ